MSEPEENRHRIVHVSDFADDGNTRLHVERAPTIHVVDNRPQRQNMSSRGIVSLITGGASGAAAWFGAHMYAQDKMLEYEAEFQKRAVDMIMGRGGLGAAAAESGLVANPALLAGGSLTNLGPGMSGALIENSVATNMLLENPQKYSFARWMRRIGGKGNFALGAGLAVGAAVGLATYAAMNRDKEPKITDNAHGDDEDWKSRVEKDKDQSHTRS